MFCMSGHWREKLHEVIFESDTPAGKAFDIALIWLILLSVLAAMLESVSSIRLAYGSDLLVVEWGFTILFTIEYAVRLLSVRAPLRYATSFFGLVDLFAILPTYLSYLVPGMQSLLVLRAFRLLRVFRIFKLASYLGEAQVLYSAIQTGKRKITVFLVAVIATVLTVGTLIYLIEGEEHGFTSIPKGVYWAIVTMTTVGYGDLSPKTAPGQFLASALMIVGYGVIAVPTGIITTELARATRGPVSAQACPACSKQGHDWDAKHCKYCGSSL